MEKKRRPKVTTGTTEVTKLVCGKLYTTINVDGNEIFECIAVMGKSGSCVRLFLLILTRFLTRGIRYGIPIEEYIEDLEGSQCNCLSWCDGVRYLSCPDAIGQVLKKKVEELKSEENQTQAR